MNTKKIMIYYFCISNRDDSISNRDDSKKYIINFDRNVSSSIFKFKDFVLIPATYYRFNLLYSALIFTQF